jgi:hypothetical protein
MSVAVTEGITMLCVCSRQFAEEKICICITHSLKAGLYKAKGRTVTYGAEFGTLTNEMQRALKVR